MRNYYLWCEMFDNESFTAESDNDAQKYVEETYDADDGEMTLYFVMKDGRKRTICSWK